MRVLLRAKIEKMIDPMRPCVHTIHMKPVFRIIFICCFIIALSHNSFSAVAVPDPEETVTDDSTVNTEEDLLPPDDSSDGTNNSAEDDSGAVEEDDPSNADDNENSDDSVENPDESELEQLDPWFFDQDENTPPPSKP